MLATATYTLTVPNYRPPRTNDLYRARFRGRMQLERECKDFIAHYGRDLPRATGRRRVSMAVYLAVRQRVPDADENALKAVLDALVACRLLVGDARAWCECRPTQFTKTLLRQPRTVITLEDLPGPENERN